MVRPGRKSRLSATCAHCSSNTPLISWSQWAGLRPAFFNETGRTFPVRAVLIAAVDERVFDSAALSPYDTAVAVKIDEAKQIQAILQVLPYTTNIAVVIGNSPFEKFWLEECKRSFKPFTNRVTFESFNELSLDEMIKRAAELPPRSAIYYATVEKSMQMGVRKRKTWFFRVC